MNKISDFLKAHISGMVDAIYFRSGMFSLLISWHLHSEFGLKRSLELQLGIKSYFVLPVYMLTLSMHDMHSIMCLDYYANGIKLK